MDLRKDVLYYDALVDFPTIGQEDKLYLDKSNGALYYWNGSSYALSGDGKGNVLSVTASAPLASSGGANPNITLSVPSDNTKFLDGSGAFDTVKDSDLSLSDITTNNVSTSKHGFTPKAPNDTTKFLRGDGTWAVPASGSSSGKFGIADSTGAYTYYTTLGAAITAASAGQTIEFFTDYTETGAVTITLKDGVNINGNGHTYICSASAGIAVFQNTGGTQVITDLTISGTNADGNTAVFYMNGGTRTTFAGCVVKTTNGWGCRSWNGIIEGLTSIVSGGKAFFSQGGTFVNCRAYSTTSVAMDVAQGYAHNCYAYSTGSTGIYGGYGVYNCIGIGSSEGIECYGGNVYNSTGYSSSGYGIKITGGSIFNCTAISSASWGVFLYASNAVVSNCTIISTAANAIYSQFISGCKISNNYITSSAAIGVRFNATNASLNNNHIDCTWNNAGGHAFQAGQSNDVLCGNVFQVANASANCLNAASAVTTKYVDSKFIGATTSVNANITQGMVNTEDTYGNITI